jgi:hypothetical protein
LGGGVPAAVTNGGAQMAVRRAPGRAFYQALACCLAPNKNRVRTWKCCCRGSAQFERRAKAPNVGRVGRALTALAPLGIAIAMFALALPLVLTAVLLLLDVSVLASASAGMRPRQEATRQPDRARMPIHAKGCLDAAL